MTAAAMLLPLAFFFQAPPTYVVSGTIIDAITGAPLSNAHVTLAGSQAFVTKADGKFRFEQVRAGTHQLVAERIGFAPQSFAQHSLTSGLSTGIVAGDKQPTEGLLFRMIPNASIAGYVRDGNGGPVEGMTVTATRIFGTGRHHRAGGSYVATTDDRGYYRLHPPGGSYSIVIAGRPLTEIASVQPMSYPVTFYPGTTDPAAAELVSAKPGEEARADLTVRPVPSVSIHGDAPAAKGRPLGSLYAAITAPSLFGTKISVSGTTSVINEKFVFPGLAAGRYHIQLIQRATDGESPRVLGAADVEASTDPTDFSIPLAAPQRISVHLTLRGQPKHPGSRPQALLEPVDGTGGSTAQIAADGTGVFPAYVQPGRYVLEAQMGSRLPVESISINGVPQAGMEFEIPETGAINIEGVANTATVDVAGRITREGAPASGILLLVAQRDTWQQIGIYRYDQSDSDGTFNWRDLPPGPYLAFALELGEPADYDNPETLRELLPIAQPLVLTGEPVQKVDLKVLPLPAK